jgi:hypothetical protein
MWTLTNLPSVTGAIFGLSYVRSHRLGEGDGEKADDAEDSRAVLSTAIRAVPPVDSRRRHNLVQPARRDGVLGRGLRQFPQRVVGGVNGSILKIMFQGED